MIKLILYIIHILIIVAYSVTENILLVNPKIVGGYNAEIHTVPYHAQILQRQNQICGATIVSQYWLISAAHCFQNRKDITIRTGSNRRSEGEMHEIRRVFIPNTYEPESLDNDISLILLKIPIRFNIQQKAIALFFRPPKIGDVVVISGFGKGDNHEVYSSILKTAYVPVVDQKMCARRHYPDMITKNMFCAGMGNTDACQGDSGGPAVINNKLVGIVSWGRRCGSTYFPGVYTNVYNYHLWIKKLTAIKI